MDLFATRIHKASLHNGVVRIEFCLVEPEGNDELSPNTPVRPEHIKFSVAMPIASLPRSISEMRKLAQELAEKGILRAPEQGEQGQGAKRQMTGTPSENDDASDDGESGPLV